MFPKFAISRSLATQLQSTQNSEHMEEETNPPKIGFRLARETFMGLYVSKFTLILVPVAQADTKGTLPPRCSVDAPQTTHARGPIGLRVQGAGSAFKAHSEAFFLQPMQKLPKEQTLQ